MHAPMNTYSPIPGLVDQHLLQVLKTRRLDPGAFNLLAADQG